MMIVCGCVFALVSRVSSTQAKRAVHERRWDDVIETSSGVLQVQFLLHRTDNTSKLSGAIFPRDHPLVPSSLRSCKSRVNNTMSSYESRVIVFTRFTRESSKDMVSVIQSLVLFLQTSARWIVSWNKCCEFDSYFMYPEVIKKNGRKNSQVTKIYHE